VPGADEDHEFTIAPHADVAMLPRARSSSDNAWNPLDVRRWPADVCSVPAIDTDSRAAPVALLHSETPSCSTLLGAPTWNRVESGRRGATSGQRETPGWRAVVAAPRIMGVVLVRTLVIEHPDPRRTTSPAHPRPAHPRDELLRQQRDQPHAPLSDACRAITSDRCPPMRPGAV